MFPEQSVTHASVRTFSCFCQYPRLQQCALDILYRVSLFRSNMDDRDSCGLKSLVNELVPALSFRPTVGTVVKLYDESDAESCRVTCHYVDMFALDSVEGVLPPTLVHTAFHLHHGLPAVLYP
jgi:hypothetical protein